MNNWLVRIKIAHKLVFCSIVFALPFAILLGYLTTRYQREIKNAQTELAGTSLLAIYPGLMRDLHEIQWRSSAAAVDPNSSYKIGETIRRRIDHAIGTLQQGDSAESRRLAIRLNGLWDHVRKGRISASENAGTASQMEEIAVQLASVILDDSRLTLDSEFQTYYFMSFSGPLLLQSQSAVARAKRVSLNAQPDGRRLSASDLSEIDKCGSLLNATLPRMRYSLEIVLREGGRDHAGDSTLQNNIHSLFEKYFGLASQLSAAPVGTYNPSNPSGTLTPGRIIQIASAAEDVGVILGEASIRELQGLLSKRIAAQRRSQSACLLIGLVYLGLAAGVMTIIGRNITQPLNYAVRLIRDISSGKVKEVFGRLRTHDCGRHVTNPKDEICILIRSVSAMAESLDGLLSKVNDACSQVTASATQMADAVREVDEAISKQASSTNEVSATSKEIFATVQEYSRTMNSVMEMASDTAAAASGGVRNLNGISFAIDELIGSSAALIDSFESIDRKTTNIDKVITTITKVANSTNLLSLNAAIEAEKAGERAGGFSVVALEIRRLADQTAVAALDIERQIREMQQAVRDGVSKIELNARQTQASSKAINELSSGLGQVIEGTAMLGPQFETVNAGMQVQSMGAGQIAEAMVNLNDAANQTKSALDEFRAVADFLHGAVSELQGEVGRFSAAS